MNALRTQAPGGGLFDQCLVGIFNAPERRLDQMVALVYRGQVEGHLDESQVEHLTEAAQCRRGVFAARRRTHYQARARFTDAPPSERRRKLRSWSASGALPPHLRSEFTPGENAVAAVIRAEVRRHGYCSLPYSAIAKAAGLLSTTVVKRFVRLARDRGLIVVKERRKPGERNKPNIITIVSRDWQRWNELAERQGGGGTSVSPIQTRDIQRTANKAPIVPAEKPQGAYERVRGRWRAKPGPGGRCDAA
jgi:hypothetical protein